MEKENFKKCLVLDLDNTLWGGVVGEDGLEGISLSTSAPGNSFVAFQQAIIDYYNRGIILAINSRNNFEDAISVIRTHPNMILRENHFATMRINWLDKVENIKDIARELNIGLDSMVFIDDDPTNRESVRFMLPQVETPELPSDPRNYAQFLHSLSYFPPDQLTDEDKLRGNLYVTERLRKEEEKQFSSRQDFLSSLKLELSIFKNDDSCLPRLSQLTEKTNQFNAFKRPMSMEEISAYMRSGNFSVYHARLTDRFGDYGVIALALVERMHNTLKFRALLMSCRVFGRGVEDAFVGTIINQEVSKGVLTVGIDFVQSEKNIPVVEFIARHFTNYSRGATLIELPPWITIRYGKV
jgi:FkbH-like protein